MSEFLAPFSDPDAVARYFEGPPRFVPGFADLPPFVPADDAVWFAGQSWAPGRIIGHHDAAPYNAVWDSKGLVGFVDDFIKIYRQTSLGLRRPPSPEPLSRPIPEPSTASPDRHSC